MAKERKHTPGPWKVVQTPAPGKGSEWREVWGPDRTSVVSVGSFERHRDGETEFHCGVRLSTENAALIAAAPDLLAALEDAERILWMAENYAEAGGSGGPELRDYRQAAKSIRAALAKARGTP